MIKHVVKPGECLATLAVQYRFDDWHAIYDAPQNEKLRKLRPNPNVLHPGDVVVIPDKTRKEEPGVTEARHRFKKRGSPFIYRQQMLDDQHQPLADMPYELRIDEREPIIGRTNAEGKFETPIPSGARSGKLRFLGEEFTLEFGFLDPVTRVSGVQARLNNLGYWSGPVDGIIGPLTRRGVYAFQKAQGLAATGAIDDATRARLLQMHDLDSRSGAAEESMGVAAGSVYADSPRSRAAAPAASNEPVRLADWSNDGAGDIMSADEAGTSADEQRAAA